MDGRLIGGRYRLLEPRGMGGTAAVWRATDERTGRPVAVKLLHPHLAADQAARERLQREALAMGGIDHPHVVAVRDLILDDDRPALIMDFIEGQSLAEAIATTGAVPEADALRIASEAADGLAAVHAAGLVHRDLKPANILLGKDGRARVTDLGIAASADPGEAALTATDGVAGTLRYLAPERLLGEPATPATDVWGLGVVLVEMLTGVAAFPATSIQARVGAAGQGVVRPDGVGDPVWAVIERATADDPTTRYATAEALAADLRRLAPVPAVAAAASDVDPWADTAVIALPVAAAPPDLATAAPIPAMAPASPPVGGPSATHGESARRRRMPLIPLAGAAVLVLVFAVAALGGSGADAPGGSGGPAGGASAPAVPNAVVTAAPSPSAPADEDDAAPSDDDKPGKGNGRGNGKGKDD
ncbi:MAG: serine/threonine-protein kinase [Candidatus Limnocylindrales bacterium]